MSELTVSDRRLSVIAWATTAMLLGFLCLTHLGVLASFLTSHTVLPFVVPVALGGALVVGDWLGRREGLCGRIRLWPMGLALGLTALAIAVSLAFYDLSWDGQWYHQVGIYRVEEGWNPLKDPMQAFGRDNTLWVRHYAKGPWYVGAALFATTGHIEAGKFVTWLTVDAACLAVLAACLDAGMRRARAITVALAVAINPVVTSEILSFLVDGLMVCFIACVVAALFSGFRRPNGLVVATGAMAVICSINSKFTGLVYLCFILAGAGLYALLARRDLLGRFAVLSGAAVVVGTLGFGYNPYVTNTVHRGHPFYPLMGTKAHPSLAQQGDDQIEKYETPHNLMGRNRFVRFGYAVFGRPGEQPYNDDPNCRLMWPFLCPAKDFAKYRYHETRIAGFGPYFSGAMLVSLLLAAGFAWKPGTARGVLLLGYGAIAASLLVSIHTWWARYGPQMWWLPILPMVAAFWGSRSRVQTGVAWGLAAILMVNALIVATVRVHWEVTATRALHRQLVEIKESGKEIEIDLQWFGEPVGKRLKTWGIPFQAVRRDQIRTGPELVSVVAGYPGGIHYRVKQ
jgi:hypothetical protein